ncbi:hypothetical protein M0R45_022983 [Rubus argutus]|uniref:Homeobox protein knotted-1-like 1 n=1 Tax=Rubus argutus TaxID=59490 RepID=A0AAW1WNI2_RUBAR
MEAFMGSPASSYKENEKPEINQDDDDETLKTRISAHPLYGLLVETHLDCLKVGVFGDDDQEENVDTLRDYMKLPDNHKPSNLGESELDHFMEAYCLALRKLKEAMEEPHQKSMSFITNMHLQLKELTSSTSQLDHLPESRAICHHTTSGLS